MTDSWIKESVMTSRMLVLIALAIALAAAAINVLFAQNPNPQVTLCHHPGQNAQDGQTLTVPSQAAPAHFAHGDSAGPCPISPSN
jgi:hypothetical protein